MFGRNALEWVLSFSKRDWSEVSWYPSDQMAEEKRSLTAGAVRLMGGVTLAVSNVLGASKICDFLLGAGPLDELLRDVPLLEGTAVILLLVTGSSRGRGVVKSWSRRLVKHEHVGGVTDWHGTICSTVVGAYASGVCETKPWAYPRSWGSSDPLFREVGFPSFIA